MGKPFRIAFVLGVLLLTGCAGASKAREAELAQIVSWLPGTYDNSAQVEADRQQGMQPHDALAVAIVPVYAPMLGENVFYSQEMAANDARRVMSQRLLSLMVSQDDRIVQSVWMLSDPLRWRDAHLNPDLFKSMQPNDVKNVPGCELLWQKEKDAERFTAAGSRSSCRSKARSPSGGTLFVETRLELAPDELALSDRFYDAQGKLVSGRADEPFYRFRRRAD
jgi:hypothetical protein